jgi:hypothetical protein
VIHGLLHQAIAEAGFERPTLGQDAAGAFVLTVELTFVAEERNVVLGVPVEFLFGAAGEGNAGEGGVGGGEVGHLTREDVLLESASALDTPGGGCHFFGATGLLVSFRQVLLEDGGAEGGEFFGVLAREEEGLRPESVVEGVEGDASLACGGARTGGKLGIGSVGDDLGVGCHG